MFTIAIVGRPNTGKSTLFNRLIGRKLALVDDQPGVTRDRRMGDAQLGDLKFRLFDTAGLDEAKKDSLEARMSAQSESAIDQADLVFFTIDARAGISQSDHEFVGRLRKMGKPIVLLANKVEQIKTVDSTLLDAFSLGLGEALPISAEHGLGLELIYDALFSYKEKMLADLEIEKPQPLRLAIIGQPNAGKSTLVNSFLGEERMLTGPEAGITRDAIGCEFVWQDKPIMLWDTAGIRRRSKVVKKLEKLAVADALRAIRFAEVVILIIDATLDIERQDLSLCDLIAKEGRAVILALNKWDAVEEKQKVLKAVQQKLDSVLPEIRGVPLLTISAQQGRGLDRLMKSTLEIYDVWNQRIGTGALNRWLEFAIGRNPPPAPSGRPIKIRYATQSSTRPPSFTLFGNQLDKMPESYIRYLMNELRKDFNFWGVPLRFNLRKNKNPYSDNSRH